MPQATATWRSVQRLLPSGVTVRSLFHLLADRMTMEGGPSKRALDATRVRGHLFAVLQCSFLMVRRPTAWRWSRASTGDPSGGGNDVGWYVLDPSDCRRNWRRFYRMRWESECWCRGAVLPSGCNRPDEIDGSEPVPR